MSGEEERKLFVAGLSDAVTEDVLRQLFEASGGKVTSLTIPQDRATGRSRGFGFVTMESSEEASQARTALDGSMQGGRPMSVRAFRGERPERGERSGRSQPAASDDATLYVGNLPFSSTAEDIIREFANSGFPEVARVHLPMDPEGRPRGFGFVAMKTAEEARRAAEELTGIMLGGRNLSISVARARGAPADRSSSPPPSRAYGSERGYGGEGRPSPRDSSPPRSMAPAGGFESPMQPNNSRGGDERRSRGAQPPDRKKDKKRKNKGGASDRSGRRGGDGFSSSRASDYVDAWDDDD